MEVSLNATRRLRTTSLGVDWDDGVGLYSLVAHDLGQNALAAETSHWIGLFCVRSPLMHLWKIRWSSTGGQSTAQTAQK